MNYYGQQGDDYILWQLFPGKTDGFFVDVGAFDGLQYSNTRSFEEQGWKGMCIEAHPFYFDLLKKNRPDAITIHGAVAAKNAASVTFYASECGVFSSLDNSLEDHFSKKYAKYFDGYEPIQVPLYTLDTLLEKHKVESVDIVSVDTEGTELTVLYGLDLVKYKPRVLILEALDSTRRDKLIEWMEKFSYIYARQQGGNYFFCRTETDAEILRQANPRGIKEIRTKHPLEKYRD